MKGEALIAWIATAFVGLTLLGIWFERGGLRRRGARRITPRLLVTHIAPAVTGLLLWISFLVWDEAALAWIAFGLLLIVASIGSTNFVIWQRRRAGILRATKTRWDLSPAEGADESIPAEQHFPVGAVVAHGLLAILTLTFVLLTAINESSRASGTVTAGPLTGAPSSVTATSASLGGNTGGRSAAARFEYGESRRYGRSVPARSAGGAGVTGSLTGLLPSSVYHYRLVVGQGEDTLRGGDRTLITAAPPRVRLRRARIAPRRFRAGGRAVLRFTLNAPATVRVGVYRVVRRARRTLFKRAATVVVDGQAGRNALPFAKRPEVRRLRSGRYKLVLVGAVVGGRPSTPRALRVRVRR